jgi:hypothetical protein
MIDAYPKQIMSNIYWGFYGGKYDTKKEFISEVIKYNNEFNNDWNPNEIILNLKIVTIQFSYWDDGEEDEIEESFDVCADNDFFTSGDLLYKIHNQVVEKLEDEDHHFFEGLTLWDGENYSNPQTPLYFLNQGS